VCANRGRGDAVGGQDFGAAVDPQVGDEDAQQRLGYVGVARGDDAAESVCDSFKGGRIRRCGRVCVHFACECLVLVLEGIEARIQDG
jgi:hypothetical protein